MPTQDQMERLLMLLDAHKNKVAPKKQPKKKMVIQEISQEEAVVSKPKKYTKKDRDAEKEREINAKMEQYLKPPAKKKPEPAPASQEATEPAHEQPKIPEPAIAIQASAPHVPAQPKASEVQNISTIIEEIKSSIQPEIDAFKMNQISSFIKSYKNRHI